MVVPVMPEASGLQRKAAVLPTSVAVTASGRGAVRLQYSIIRSMMPMAEAAREAQGPAEVTFTRCPQRRPAPEASTRVSLSSAASADDIPPPYPGITRSEARYVRERNEPPG